MSDPDAAKPDEGSPLPGLGDRLRALRRERGLSLAELAKASGVPLSTISKIENHQLNPSLVHSINLAHALDANLGFLVHRKDSGAEAFQIIRQDEAPCLDFPEMGLRLFDVHGAFPSNLLEARLGVITAGGRSGDEPMQHDGEELCHVLSGAMRFQIEDELFDLGAGDTIQFKCVDPHSWQNIAAGETRVLWVFSDGLSF